MQRPWMVLVVVGVLLVAGCSAPSSQPQSPDEIDYPAGWSEAGLTNTTAAVQGADDAIGDSDFVERRAFVRPLGPNASADALVRVLVVRIDHDASRLVTDERFYRVDDTDVDRVVEEGVSVLSSYESVESRVTYLNETGAYRYLNLSGREPTVRSMDGGTYRAAVDQPLPAVFATTVETLAGGNYSNPTSTEAGIRYDVASVPVGEWNTSTGHVLVRSNGLVGEFVLTEETDAGTTALAYELDVRDVSVEEPAWL